MTEKEENVDLSNSNWNIDQSVTSGIIYDSLVGNYGKPAVDAVIEKLELHSEDLSLGDNFKVILKILNGEL